MTSFYFLRDEGELQTGIDLLILTQNKIRVVFIQVYKNKEVLPVFYINGTRVTHYLSDNPILRSLA